MPVALLQAIRRVARRVGIPVYLVGGPLRDVLLGRPAADIDIAVEGDSARFGKALARELRGTFKGYRQFGTGTVVLKGFEGIRGNSSMRAGRLTLRGPGLKLMQVRLRSPGCAPRTSAPTFGGGTSQLMRWRGG